MAALDPRGIALIKEFEGCHLTAYRCPSGVPTIGWGSTIGLDGQPVRLGTTITQQEADRLFERDLNHFAQNVDRLVKVLLTPSQRAALVSCAYNVGIGALAQSTLLRLLNAEDYQGAAAQFDRWTRGAGRVLPGLVRRRQAEKALFLSALPDALPAKPKPRPLLRQGSRGQAVAELQYLLNQHGYRLDQDAIFGSLAQAAVKDYQAHNGLAVDGIVGPQTWTLLLRRIE